MANDSLRKNINVPQCNYAKFIEELRCKLAILTGLDPNVEWDERAMKYAKYPILVLGDPGIGKTCGIAGLIKEFNEILPEEKHLHFIKLLLGQTIVGELSGIPVVVDNGVKRVITDVLPKEDRDGKFGVLFLDEITTAELEQTAPAYGLLDDTRSLGKAYTLPENWIVVAAGNGPNSSNFKRLDDALLSRFAFSFDILYDYLADWKPWAYKNNIDSDILAFLDFDNTSIVRVISDPEIDEEGYGKRFACPRTWEMFSNVLYSQKLRHGGKELSDEDMRFYACQNVGEITGREFAAFMEHKKHTSADPKKILDGSEPLPNRDELNKLTNESICLLYSKCVDYLKEDLNAGKLFDEYDEGTEYCYSRLQNFFNWFLGLGKFVDLGVQIIVSIYTLDPRFAAVITSEEMDDCVALYEFLSSHSALLTRTWEGIKKRMSC